MSRPVRNARTPEEARELENVGLKAENQRKGRDLRAAEETIGRQRQVIAEQSMLILELRLREHLHDPGDFFKLVPLETFVDDDGAVIWPHAAALLEGLLTSKPYLGNPWSESQSAVDWMNQPV